MKSFISTVSFLILFSVLSWSAEGIKYESITNKNGLSHNTVRGIMQDRRGFMWIGTMNGLNRYDGKEFIVMQPQFGLPSLTENKIKKAIEDSNGRIWVFSTSDIVNCYDTHIESFVDYTGQNEVRRYSKFMMTSNGDVWLYGLKNGACRIRYVDRELSSTLYDKNSIHSDVVNFVHEDAKGQIWIGTNKELLKITDGVLEYCITGDTEENFKHVVEFKESICFITSNNNIVIFNKDKKRYSEKLNILPDRKSLRIHEMVALDENEILVTAREDIILLDISEKKLEYSKSLFGQTGIKRAHLFIDNKENYWIYNKSGSVWLYNKDKSEFTKYDLIPESILSLIDLERYDFYVDSRNIAWVTTYGNGIFGINLITGEIKHLTTANSELKTNYLLCVSEDRTGNIWVGTEFTGITKISLSINKNKIFYPRPAQSRMGDRIIRTIYEDKEGDIWIGTKSGTIYRYDSLLNEKELMPLVQGMAYFFEEDNDGNKWIGTKGNGLLLLKKEGRKYSQQVYTTSTGEGITNNNIYTVFSDSKGRMWIGTYGGGLLLSEQQDGRLSFKNFPTIADRQPMIRCIAEDSLGNIWIGGNEGLIVFDPDQFIKNSEDYQHYRFNKEDASSLSNNEVKAIYKDSQSRIWIGTSGSGISIAQRDVENQISFKHYSIKDGLINNVVQAIIEDDNENLWVSTESGLSKFNVDLQTFENYSFSDAWDSNLFCESAVCKRKNGELLFGSHDGLYIINPMELDRKDYNIPVTITGLRINGNPISPNTPDSPLSRSITETSMIELKDGQNSFSIEFASLIYQNMYSDRYIYILENYDDAWNPITEYNVATYKNIPPGKYVFKVKSYNSSGSLNQHETVLNIIVTPPFWKSWQALVLYLILAVVIAYFVFRLIVKMNKLNNDVEIEKQLTELKLRFFTNISHEFRTPLTIIQGSIESMNMIKPLPQNLKKQIHILGKSSDRLMRLVDQLLEFRKLQKGQLDLKLEYVEVVQFFHDIYNQFVELAENKSINFTFSSNEESRIVMIDQGKIDKIIFNLLSNAFRNTPTGGNIKLDLLFDKEKQEFVFKVSDSGVGIPSDKKDLLFIRFQQINYSNSGIGIGLNLTHELVNIHHGKIEYKDSEWGGAVFMVSLPLSEKAYEGEEIFFAESDSDHTDVLVLDNSKELSEQIGVKEKADYTILIIEDDKEIREFLNDQLGAYFTVLTATNGLEGLEKATELQPDLVICDVMMPKMNGYEVTQKLKNDFATSHLPIILLTASSSLESRVEGIDAGADSYITKPFSIRYLFSRITKLIEQREKLRNRLSQHSGMVQRTITTNEKDKDFIDKINNKIEEELGNADFSVELFAQSFNLSRTLFYKKVKGLTGYAPNEYIRMIRLRRASELLRISDMNISEIAYKVGFNDPFYFSKCFKDQFKVTPTQFREE